MPRVSVVMPVFAQAPFVATAVSSLLAQGVSEWELIVVDDGSPDDVAAALPHDERVVLLRHRRNRGVGAALNAGSTVPAPTRSHTCPPTTSGGAATSPSS